jgi:hypothetical protein
VFAQFEPLHLKANTLQLCDLAFKAVARLSVRNVIGSYQPCQQCGPQGKKVFKGGEVSRQLSV